MTHVYNAEESALGGEKPADTSSLTYKSVTPAVTHCQKYPVNAPIEWKLRLK